MPVKISRSAQEIFWPYFCLIGQSRRRALSRLALSGQLFRGAKRWAPVPPPPRPSSMRYVPADFGHYGGFFIRMTWHAAGHQSCESVINASTSAARASKSRLWNSAA